MDVWLSEAEKGTEAEKIHEEGSESVTAGEKGDDHVKDCTT